MYYSYEWHDGSSSTRYTTTQEGMISVRVSDSLGCYAEDEMYLEVKPLPEVYLGRDTSLCGDQMLYLSGGSDASLFEWSTGERSYEIAAYQGRQDIWVVVEDDFGCTNSDTILIYDCDPSVYFSDIPTAITPNGDGHNDTWRLEKLEAYPDAVIEIFDRWGRMVYKSESGYTTPWDGRDMNGDLVPMDSYHFVILLNFEGSYQYVGAVTVIR
jgi:gliding motility-associated-like protein